jgi:hypothetical protein
LKAINFIKENVARVTEKELPVETQQLEPEVESDEEEDVAIAGDADDLQFLINTTTTTNDKIFKIKNQIFYEKIKEKMCNIFKEKLNQYNNKELLATEANAMVATTRSVERVFGLTSHMLGKSVNTSALLMKYICMLRDADPDVVFSSTLKYHDDFGISKKVRETESSALKKRHYDIMSLSNLEIDVQQQQNKKNKKMQKS